MTGAEFSRIHGWLVLTAFWVGFAAAVSAQEPGPGKPAAAGAVDERAIRDCIERALDFVQADAVKWRNEHTCSTCHHGTMTMWVQLAARQRGFPIAPDQLQENVAWAKARILERVDLPRDTRPGWSMVNTPAIYLAIMAQAVPAQESVSAEELKRVVGHLLRHQEENGAWMWTSAPPKNIPPPFFESDEVATRIAWLALAPHRRIDGDEGTKVRESLAKAEKWLEQASPTETTQACALRLLMTVESESAPGESRRRRQELLERQNADGGWSQIKERPSDAYATGQVLFALSQAGVEADSPQVRQAAAFLVRTQAANGSWPMTRRGHPGVTPSDNVVPITYFGTAWAALGLLPWLPARP